jgi:hypothetical protein
VFRTIRLFPSHHARDLVVTNVEKARQEAFAHAAPDHSCKYRW